MNKLLSLLLLMLCLATAGSALPRLTGSKDFFVTKTKIFHKGVCFSEFISTFALRPAQYATDDRDE